MPQNAPAWQPDFGQEVSPFANLPETQLNVAVADWQWVVIAIVLLLGLLWLVFLILRKRLARMSYLTSAFRSQLLRITIPKPEIPENAQDKSTQRIKEEVGLAEGLFTIIGSLKAQRGLKAWWLSRSDVFSFEIVSVKGSIDFYLLVPNEYQQLVEQQLHAINTNTQIEAVDDYNIFAPQSTIVGRHLVFGNNYIFPLKTYKNLEGDPLNSILNSMNKIDEQSTAAIQFVFRSAHKKWRYPGASFVREIQKGKKITEALVNSGLGGGLDKVFKMITELIGLFASAKEKKPEELQQGKALSGLEEEVMKTVEEKMSKAGLDANLRIVVCAPQPGLAESYVANIANSFAQFNFYKYGNVLKENKKKQERLISDFIHRYYEPAYGLIVNAEEATSLMHLPTSGCEAPRIHWLDARSAPPPLNLPKEGIILGISNYRGEKQEVRFAPTDRRRHMYIIGKSGTGKSTLMQNMIVQDIANGSGVCVVDPHGDLVEYVLNHIPKERAEDVILFDPANTERPLGLNMLEFESTEQKTFVINEMLAIFDKLYDLKATGGPMFEQYMRNAILLLMEDPDSGATLLEVPRVLSDESFRAFKLSKCQNLLVKDFWEKEAQKAGGEAALVNIVPYITSKLTPFVYSDIMRPIISQAKSSFNFRQAMDDKKIILLNLTKGKIGEMSSNLLGMVIIGKLLMAALSRVNIPEADRQDFYLYIDEFQNFITDTIGVILSEARKYRLNLTVGHQFIAQLVKNNDTKIRDAVLGNIGTLAAFRLGPEDTEVMAKQFAPVFNQRDLLNIPRYNLYLKLLINSQNAPAFNIQPVPPTPGDPVLAEHIKQLSSLKYGRPRAEVEQEVLERVKMTGGSLEDFKLA